MRGGRRHREDHPRLPPHPRGSGLRFFPDGGGGEVPGRTQRAGSPGCRTGGGLWHAVHLHRHDPHALDPESLYPGRGAELADTVPGGCPGGVPADLLQSPGDSAVVGYFVLDCVLQLRRGDDHQACVCDHSDGARLGAHRGHLGNVDDPPPRHPGHAGFQQAHLRLAGVRVRYPDHGYRPLQPYLQDRWPGPAVRGSRAGRDGVAAGAEGEACLPCHQAWTHSGRRGITCEGFWGGRRNVHQGACPVDPGPPPGGLRVGRGRGGTASHRTCHLRSFRPLQPLQPIQTLIHLWSRKTYALRL
eukprot:Hpha_TRINITY_DN12992_c0_g2::TRINITY_DN12992_c0_g2_i1::g.164444::m.164444